MTTLPLRIGGIVLCGGRSSRMGRPKHLLPIAGRPALCMVVEALRQVVSPVVVVGAPGQEVPALPEGVRTVHDEQEHLGPLSGLRTGLRAIGGEVDAVFLTGCDTPLLKPAVVTRIIGTLDDEIDAAAIVQEGFIHPLAAVYRVTLLPAVERMIAANELRPRVLIQRHRHRTIDPAELKDVDPELHSLRNMNTWDDYLELLDLAAET